MAQEVALLIRHQTRRKRAAALATAVTAAVFALGACDSGGGDEKANSGADKGPSIVAPGKPGEPARQLSADEAREEAVPPAPNSADFRYARMMIQHHSQALVMTGLVADRAGSSTVKRFADRIASGQKPEIAAMEGWLKNNGGDKRKRSHDHSRMPGMATEAQLDELRAARGRDFDERFLKLMITHHQGAVTMATEVLSEGNNVPVEEMATDVVAQQTVEIDRMRDLLR
ncbi:DUF305 domain-containing protein [Streptomyces fulvorobeus]|uniref:Uncharacterized protein (DUF305 family) n=1 Tax=Streptomyces fulvorobeus TaxID=284028 RepID=A0A7Y9H7R3_9ACTN|nr:DUF305 domain-containing protein [Streptomyces fulvorobeus]NYE39472.1 uncharacterized protein (DUF305 family) [Streptomyces fulvorobeus]